MGADGPFHSKLVTMLCFPLDIGAETGEDTVLKSPLTVVNVGTSSVGKVHAELLDSTIAGV